MTSRLLISLSLALLTWQTAVAQIAPADDFFKSGAQLYISNNIPSALARTEAGLKIYPDNVKLKKLEELLKQQQQSQQQQSQQNQQDQSQKQDQQNQNQQKPDQNQPPKDQQSKSQPEQPKDQQQPQPANSAGKQDDEKKDDQQAQASADKEMSPQEAQKLLDAQKGNEQLLQLKPPGKPQDNQKPVKDW